MKVSRVTLVLFLILLGAGWSEAALDPKMAPKTDRSLAADVEILRSDFGLVNSPESGKPFFVSTKEVPMIENQAYGWIIHVQTKKTKIRWREELTLPSAPTTWGETETRKHYISEDKKVSVLEREVEPKDGLIFNFWSIEPGDPKGHYVIRVIIEDTLERVFEFEVK
jgi:hypothetical protein